MSHIVSHYLHPVMGTKKLKNCATMLSQLLQKYKNDFDTIAFCGVSGTMIGPLLSIMMEKKMLAIRKDSSHSMYKVEGDYSATRYIIVDDFVASGKTVYGIHNDIIDSFNTYNQYRNEEGYHESQFFDVPVCVGMAFYSHCLGTNYNTIRSIHCLEKFPVDGFALSAYQ